MACLPMKIVIFLASMLYLTTACKVADWRHFPMKEILYKADIVVSGKEIDWFEVPVSDPSFPFDSRNDSHFEVFCVFKNDDPQIPIPTNIIVEEVYPRTTCSGTEVKPNTEYIVALKRRGDNFVWHEINVQDSAAYEATEDNIQAALDVCDMQPILPEGRDSSQGPICPSQVAREDCVRYIDELGIPSRVDSMANTVTASLLVTILTMTNMIVTCLP